MLKSEICTRGGKLPLRLEQDLRKFEEAIGKLVLLVTNIQREKYGDRIEHFSHTVTIFGDLVVVSAVVLYRDE